MQPPPPNPGPGYQPPNQGHANQPPYPPVHPAAYNAQPPISNGETNLNNLAIGFYIWGGMLAFFSLFSLIYVFLGIAMQSGSWMDMQPKGSGFASEQANIGRLFVVIGLVVLVIGETMAVLTIIAGRKLKRRKGYMFVMIMAGFSCLSFPFGTTLGVLTFIVMTKPHVKQLFGR